MKQAETLSTAPKAAAIAAFVLFLATVAVNALANILPINGVQTGALSDEIPNLFVPAGLTFSIWGLIYLLLAAYGAAVLVVAFRPMAGPTSWKAADGWAFSLNMAANSLWIVAWHYRRTGLSFLLMLVILGTLLFLEERGAARDRGGAGKAATGGFPLRFLLRTPVNVYLGWICVATIANLTAVLVRAGWDGFGLDPRAWTLAVIAAAIAVGLLLVFLRGAVAAPLVIVWAFAGIAVKRLGVDADYSAAVWISAVAGAALLAAAAGVRWAVAARRTGPSA
jgi:hypothetical protein